MWANESIFYHIYPLGLCGAEEYNHFSDRYENRIGKVSEWIDHLLFLGVNSVYFGPIFESTKHGYDTADYFRLDRRLGNNVDFQKVAEDLHNNGIKIVLDGVFNHVGRDFWAFKDVLQNKQSSRYLDWFFIRFDGNNSYNDGLIYQDWEGCSDLVKLNLKNHEVKQHLFHAIKTWVEDYNIDGLRLDVAYCLDKDFLKELRLHCKSIKADFWLLGETIHGDYNEWMNPEMLDSVTNYECYKGLFSSCNSLNMFEIAHSLKRQFSEDGQALYLNKNLYSFVDNHDVSRIASTLKDERHLRPLYALLFSMPGIPSVYYGSEWGIKGEKNSGDSCLRPFLDAPQKNDFTHFLSELSKFRRENKSLTYGSINQIYLENKAFAFERVLDNQRTLCVFNIGEKPVSFKYRGHQVSISPYSARLETENGKTFLTEVPCFCSTNR